jgi:hypothetical protein
VDQSETDAEFNNIVGVSENTGMVNIPQALQQENKADHSRNGSGLPGGEDSFVVVGGMSGANLSGNNAPMIRNRAGNMVASPT